MNTRHKLSLIISERKGSSALRPPKWDNHGQSQACSIISATFSKTRRLSWHDIAFVFLSGGSVAHVHAIVRGTALLPCDLTPPAPNDSVVLVVWYKDEHTPIYRYLQLSCRVISISCACACKSVIRIVLSTREEVLCMWTGWTWLCYLNEGQILIKWC